MQPRRRSKQLETRSTLNTANATQKTFQAAGNQVHSKHRRCNPEDVPSSWKPGPTHLSSVDMLPSSLLQALSTHALLVNCGYATFLAQITRHQMLGLFKKVQQLLYATRPPRNRGLHHKTRRTRHTSNGIPVVDRCEVENWQGLLSSNSGMAVASWLLERPILRKAFW